MTTRLDEAARRHHFEAVLVLHEIEDELAELVEQRDKRQRLLDSLERLCPDLLSNHSGGDQ